MKVYVPLDETSDMINKINGANVNQTASQYVSGSSGAAWFENNTPAYYPDLVVNNPGWTSAPIFTVNGHTVQSVELIGGAHPPQRPR